MKKFFILLGVLAALAMVSVAWADTLVIGTTSYTVTAVTASDQHDNNTISNTATPAWGAPYGKQEYQEVELSPPPPTGTGYYATTGDSWDFRGMWYAPTTKMLYVVAGFDLAKGGHYSNDPDYTNPFPLGDLFIKIGSPQPILTNDGAGGTVVTNASFDPAGYGYSYAWRLNGDVWSLSGSSVIQANATSYVGAGNPYQYLSGGLPTTPIVVSTGRLSTSTPSTGTDTENQITYPLTGDYYACYNLGFLGNFSDAFFHLSYSCGNDAVNGYFSSGAVPIPGALVLLGAGLVRLAAYGRRRRGRVEA